MWDSLLSQWLNNTNQSVGGFHNLPVNMGQGTSSWSIWNLEVNILSSCFSLSLRLSVSCLTSFPPSLLFFQTLECRLTYCKPGDRRWVSGTAFQVLTTSPGRRWGKQLPLALCLRHYPPGFISCRLWSAFGFQAVNHEQEWYQGWRGTTNRSALQQSTNQ